LLTKNSGSDPRMDGRGKALAVRSKSAVGPHTLFLLLFQKTRKPIPQMQQIDHFPFISFDD